MESKRKWICLKPTQALALGFAAIILLGTSLLMLPVANSDGQRPSLLDALFTATSAVCVTGLVVRDTGTSWTIFGQVVLLLLIQVGGLGFMSMASVIFLLLGRHTTLRERLVLRESLSEFQLQGLGNLTLRIVGMTLLFEMAGVMLYSTRFIPLYGMKRGLYMSVFHAVSAFCNAGFDIVGAVEGPYSSFIPYRSDVLINVVTMLLFIIGGLGFTVLMDIYRQRRFSRLSLHSKVVILMTAGLLLSGWIFFFITEYANRNTLGDPGLSLPDKLMAALFQSATTRTAGFNTVDQGSLNAASKFMSALLMFVGASPAGTGGGVKTSTVAVLLLVVITVVQGKEDITLFQRRLARGIGFRALAITLISFGLVLLITMVLSLSERAIPFENLLFETISAFGTVGLSTGITPYLKPVSKVFIIITMFAGRVGSLTLATAFARRLRIGNAGYKYPEDRIIVG